MGFISGYPKDSSISLSDKLLGTDAESSLATKNFEIGDFVTFLSNQSSISGISKSVKVTLTPLQIQSLFTTRVKVIDCPTGYAVLPIQMLCVTNNPTTAYSPNGGGVVLRYDTLVSNILSCNTNLGSVGIGEGYATSATSLTSGEFSRNGEDVYIKAASNDPVGGDGGMVVYITYSLIAL